MSRSKQILAAAVAGICLIAGAVWWFVAHREPTGARALISCLPRSAATLLFINVDGMRKTGVLDILAGSKAAEDADYKAFIAATGFDYRRDLREVVGSFRAGDSFFLLSGDFDWNRLNSYATSQGGACRDQLCRMRSSQPGRWVSFYKVGSHSLAIAFSANEFAALDIAPRPAAAGSLPDIPNAPVWLWVPAASVRNADLPPGTRSFATPLEGAEQILLTLGLRDQNLEMNLNVTCPNAAAASDLLVKLEGATNMLRKLIERENVQPNPADLSGLLTSGAFRRDDRKVYGVWPIRKEFLQTIANGGAK